MLISEIPEVLTVYNFVYSGCPFGCSNHPHLLEKVGERGRNRTYNLLIKSQLLCQLSYAPFGSGIHLAGGGPTTNFIIVSLPDALTQAAALFRDQVSKILLIFIHNFVEQICIQPNLLM